MTSNQVESDHAKLKSQLWTSQGNFEKCLSNIHSCLNCSIRRLRLSFKSLTIIHCSFMLPNFRELKGLMSIHVSNLILSQLKRGISIGVNLVACSCIIRHTHNLSYTHEITMYKRDNQLIPLDCIDYHWQKLTCYQQQRQLLKAFGTRKNECP